MSHALKKNCDETTVNQRCATFQQTSDPILPPSNTQSAGLFGGDEGTGLGSGTASSTVTTNTNGANSSAHSRVHGGAYSDASVGARTNYRSAIPSTVTYPSDFWRRNLSGNSMYNSYSPGMYGQMPMFPPSGGLSSCLPFTMQSGYGSPQTMFGCMTPSPDNDGLARYAHEQSRGVFEKAAYTIQTVGSITHMLDTIFMGCTGSFNAILTVISQLSQLKNHFGRVISAFAVLRSIRWLYARVLRALGLRSAQDVEDAWREAVEGMAAQQSGGGQSKNRGSWRRAVLLACLCALPALLWQLMKAMTADEVGGAKGSTDRPGTDARPPGEAAGGAQQQGFGGHDPRAAPLTSGYPQPVNPAYGALGGYGGPVMGGGTYPYGGQAGGYSPYGSGGYDGYNPTGYPSNPYGSSYSRYGGAYPSYNTSGGNYYSGVGTAQSYNGYYGGAPTGLRNYGEPVQPNSVPQRRVPAQPPVAGVNNKIVPGKDDGKKVNFTAQNNTATTFNDVGGGK